jgi:hypothetical protein
MWSTLGSNSRSKINDLHMLFFQLKNRAEAAGATSDRCSGHVQRARECEIPDRSIAREA